MSWRNLFLIELVLFGSGAMIQWLARDTYGATRNDIATLANAPIGLGMLILILQIIRRVKRRS